jgi:hypothetical protein
MIKSALEIALERTKEIKVDKESLAAHTVGEEGQRLAGRLLAGEIDAQALASALKERKGKEADWLKEGCFSTLAANLNLPQTEEFKEKTERLEEGFIALTGEKRQVAHLFQQINEFFEQYLQNQEQIMEALENQFAPRLREREQEMARQLGSQVKLSPSQDPEFSKALKQHLGRLEAQYGDALKQAKEQLKSLFA